jgi:hypothetical protein
MRHLPDTAVKGFAINTCMHLPSVRKNMLRKLNLSIAYQLRYNLYSVPDEIKSELIGHARTSQHAN